MWLQVAEDPDVAQAQVFLRALTEETADTTALLDDARRLAAEARSRGSSALALWHEQQAKAHKRTLQELFRQSQNLRTGFPLTTK